MIKQNDIKIDNFVANCQTDCIYTIIVEEQRIHLQMYLGKWKVISSKIKSVHNLIGNQQDDIYTQACNLAYKICLDLNKCKKSSITGRDSFKDYFNQNDVFYFKQDDTIRYKITMVCNCGSQSHIDSIGESLFQPK